MNPFINPKKRGIQLPHGAKDLVDVLRPRRKNSQGEPKCEYCGAPAAAMSILGATVERWCKECIRDLKAFAAQQDYKFNLDPTDDEEALARFREDLQRRQDEFMQQRIRARAAQ